MRRWRTVDLIPWLVISSLIGISPAFSQGAPDTVPLGFIAPLSGPFAQWGQSIRRGVELAVQDTKTSFSVDYQDDRCEPVQALAIAERFFSAKIRYVLGPGCDHCLVAIAPVAERAGMVLFSTGLLAESVLATHKGVVNLATQISAEAQRLAREMANAGIKRAAIVHGTNAFGEEYARRLREYLRSRSVQVMVESAPLGTTDFKSLLARILSDRPDAVFIHQGEQETIAFVKQLRVLDRRIPVYSQYGFETQATRDAGVDLNGVLYTYPLNSAEDSPAKLEFDRRFAARFGADAVPTATTYYVYDGVQLLDRAIQRCSPDKPDCVVAFFGGLSAWQGISGTMQFRPDGGLVRQYGVKRLQDGKFEWVSKAP